jgi:hypothetical protein
MAERPKLNDDERSIFIPEGGISVGGEAADAGRRRLARRRLGNSATQYLGWLIEFTEAAPEAVAADPAQTDAEIGVFVERILGGEVGAREFQTTRPAPHSPELTAEIAGLHRQAKDAFKKMLVGQAFELKIDSHVLGGRPGHGSFRGARSTAFLVALHRLLVVDLHARLAKRCARCSRVFISRTSGIYCGSRCALDSRLSRFRELSPEERSRRRHETYLRKVARTKGKGFVAKVARRGPRGSNPEPIAPIQTPTVDKLTTKTCASVDKACRPRSRKRLH